MAVRPRRVGGSSATVPSVSTPAQALRLDEARRNRTMAFFVLALVAPAAPLLEILGGDLVARRLFQAGLLAGGLTALAIIFFLRDPSRYRPWQNVTFGYVCIVLITAGLYFFGPFSAVLLVVPFGAFIFCVGESFAGALSITLSLCTIHAGLSVATVMGLLPDVGVIRPVALTAEGKVVTLALIQLVIAATFIVARIVRRSQVHAMEELERTVRALGQREALLEEARQDLKAALRIGGPGRYTDQTVGGFRLGVILGRGAMGEIYEAQRVSDGQVCAVKLLHPHVRSQPQHFERFRREAEVAASLDEPHVVKVLEIATEDEVMPYIAMERLRGHDLASELKERPRMRLDEVVDLVRQVGKGLEAAHRAGIVHRDLKPQNIFRTEAEDGSPLWKILDFGVSKLASHGGTLTRGHVVGTPSYMAPEQAKAEDVDLRADLYSLGVIAYRALTGRPAFGGTDIHRILFQVVYKMPVRPSAAAHLPEELDAVFAIALAKKPEDRFGSAEELAAALEAAGAGLLPERLRRKADALLARLPWAEE